MSSHEYRGPLITAEIAQQMHNLQQEKIDALLAENQQTHKALKSRTADLLAAGKVMKRQEDENQRLREALERIATDDRRWGSRIAREALAGDAE